MHCYSIAFDKDIKIKFIITCKLCNHLLQYPEFGSVHMYVCQLWYGTMLTEYVYKGIFFWISGISSKSIAEQR